MEKVKSSVDYSICHETILDCYIFHIVQPASQNFPLHFVQGLKKK